MPNSEQWLTRDEIKQEIQQYGISPGTRRLIVWCLATIAIVCVSAEVLLAWMGADASDALVAISATAVGGIAGLAVPPPPPGD